jgi:hypothetical protein
LGQGAGEERTRSMSIAALRNENVDDLPELIDRPVQVRPAAGNLDVGLVHEPPIAGCVPSGPGRVHELRRERLCWL